MTTTLGMQIAQIKHEYDTLRAEHQICRRKLESKCEALLILTKDLDQCRQERDQFKLMAEQVQERYQALKRQLAGVGPKKEQLSGVEFAGKSSENLAHLLCEMREGNKTLQFEADDLRQKLADAQGDIKLLREQIARQRVGTTDEGMNTRHFPAHEREDLVKQLENSREEFVQLERDLQQVLDEKEELVTERDVYKTKHERLNSELNYVLKGDEKRIVDIDTLVMENKYLKDRYKQMEEEKNTAMTTVTKYKAILEKKKSRGFQKLGQSRSGGVVITQKQVQQLLESKQLLPSTPQMMTDLQSLAGALLETVHDKNLAISHQRKTNKILGTRVSELEKKLKTLEVAGLWSLPGANTTSPAIDKLRKECEEIKTLMPSQTSHSQEDVGEKGILDSFDEASPVASLEATPQHKSQASAQNAGLSLEDLDLLPTKEDTSGEVAAGEAILSPCTDTSFSETDTLLDGLHEDLDGGGEHEEDDEDEDGVELRAMIADAAHRVMEHARRGEAENGVNAHAHGDGGDGEIQQTEVEDDAENTVLSPTCNSPLLDH